MIQVYVSQIGNLVKDNLVFYLMRDQEEKRGRDNEIRIEREKKDNNTTTEKERNSLIYRQKR